MLGTDRAARLDDESNDGVRQFIVINAVCDCDVQVAVHDMTEEVDVVFNMPEIERRRLNVLDEIVEFAQCNAHINLDD